MRALIATLICLAVLAGAALIVARNASNADATLRANAARALIAGANCGCTADVRAKDRIANRDTADDAGSK
ncbi:MAG: hypothetical protein ACR2J9_10195 [Gaiellales bacterium]